MFVRLANEMPKGGGQVNFTPRLLYLSAISKLRLLYLSELQQLGKAKVNV